MKGGKAPKTSPGSSTGCSARGGAATWVFAAAAAVLTVVVVLCVMEIFNLWPREYFDSSASKPAPRKAKLEAVFVKMNGCGHCDQFEPVWEAFRAANASELSGVVDIVKFERQDPEWVKRGVRATAFPYVAMLDKGDGRVVSEFKDDRTVADLAAWARRSSAAAAGA
jgi:hypothetical protein